MMARTSTTIRITNRVKQALDKEFDPKQFTYSEALNSMLAIYTRKWNWLEAYIAVVATIVLILELVF